MTDDVHLLAATFDRHSFGHGKEAQSGFIGACSLKTAACCSEMGSMKVMSVNQNSKKKKKKNELKELKEREKLRGAAEVISLMASLLQLYNNNSLMRKLIN